MKPRPRARAIATALSVIAAFVATDPLLLAIALIVCSGLTFFTRTGIGYLKAVVAVVLPLAGLLLFVWAVIVGSPPGEQPGTNIAGACRYASVIALRFGIVTAVVNISFLSVSAGELPSLFRGWGAREEGLVICMAAVALVPEMRRRLEQVYVARLAAGLMRKRSFLRRLLQIPHLLRPVFTFVLRSSLQRAELWHQKRILLRVDELAQRSARGSLIGSVVWLALAGGWLLAAIATRCIVGW